MLARPTRGGICVRRLGEGGTKMDVPLSSVDAVSWKCQLNTADFSLLKYNVNS